MALFYFLFCSEFNNLSIILTIQYCLYWTFNRKSEKKLRPKGLNLKSEEKKSTKFSHFFQLFSKYTNCSYLLWGGLKKGKICLWDVSFSMSLTYLVGSFVVVAAVVIWYLIVIVCGMFIWQYGEHKKRIIIYKKVWWKQHVAYTCHLFGIE